MACIRNLMIVKEAYISEPHLVISRWVAYMCNFQKPCIFLYYKFSSPRVVELI